MDFVAKKFSVEFRVTGTAWSEIFWFLLVLLRALNQWPWSKTVLSAQFENKLSDEFLVKMNFTENMKIHEAENNS